MKNKYRILTLCSLMVLASNSMALVCPTAEHPIAEIKDANDLMNMTKCTNTAGKTFLLDNDINLNNSGGSMPLFEGIFDGQGHKISGFSYYNGLFSVIQGDAIIKNLKLDKVSINASHQNCASSLVATQSGGLISNVSVTNATITAYDPGPERTLGGLVGKQENGTIDQSSFTGNINLQSRVYLSIGGLVGEQAPTQSGNVIKIIRSFSSGTLTINGSASSMPKLGGLVGTQGSFEPDEISIDSSYSDMNIDISNASGAVVFVGNLIGNSSGTIQNSYANGSIKGNDTYPGIIYPYSGLIGWSDSKTRIINCYSTTKFFNRSKDKTAGLVGLSSGGEICENSFWDKDVTGAATSAVCVDGGKNTQQMQDKNTYTGWDFQNIWKLIGPNTYPALIWQSIAKTNASSRPFSVG